MRISGRLRGFRYTGVIAVALAAGCPQPTPPEAEPGVADVSVRNLAFDPQVVTIEAGESVRWTNFDAVSHTATSGDPGDSDAGSVWDSGTLSTGESFSRQFAEVGEFVYFCEFHPTIMRGARVVVMQPEE